MIVLIIPTGLVGSKNSRKKSSTDSISGGRPDFSYCEIMLLPSQFKSGTQHQFESVIACCFGHRDFPWQDGIELTKRRMVLMCWRSHLMAVKWSNALWSPRGKTNLRS